VAKKRGLRSEGGLRITEEEISPLSLFSILLSVSAICNAQARWLFANLDDLREHGGYAAASDLQLTADVLLAMVEDNLEEWQKTEVQMPPGFAHVPWSVRTASVEEKGDLPF
jgi:hypothetical protein